MRIEDISSLPVNVMASSSPAGRIMIDTEASEDERRDRFAAAAMQALVGQSVGFPTWRSKRTNSPTP